MQKTISTVVVLLCLVVCAVIPAAAAPAQPDYSKIVDISLKYDNNAYSVLSTEVRYGKAPDLNLRSGSLTGTILDSSGKALTTFSMQEPGIAYGDILTGTEGNGIIGYTERSGSGTMTVTVPFIPGMRTFHLSNARGGSVLATADLETPAVTFCADYPLDPDCQVQLAQPKAATPDTSLYYVLAAVLSVSAAIAAGLAILTIRKRASPEGPREEPKARRKQTILIVDDNPDIVDMLHLLLERKGYATFLAQSGKECLDIIKKEVPDLILLDIMMEPMDGWQTLEEIRKNPDAKAVPVLMLTAKRLTAVEARKYRLLMNDYLQKPVDPADLYLAVEHFLDRKQKIHETLALASKAGVERAKICELADLDHRISINNRILDILHIPQAVPVAADMEVLDTMSVVDYLHVKQKDNEHRISQLRSEINMSFQSKGLPDLPL